MKENIEIQNNMNSLTNTEMIYGNSYSDNYYYYTNGNVDDFKNGYVKLYVLKANTNQEVLVKNDESKDNIYEYFYWNDFTHIDKTKKVLYFRFAIAIQKTHPKYNDLKKIIKEKNVTKSFTKVCSNKNFWSDKLGIIKSTNTTFSEEDINHLADDDIRLYFNYEFVFEKNARCFYGTTGINLSPIYFNFYEKDNSSSPDAALLEIYLNSIFFYFGTPTLTTLTKEYNVKNITIKNPSATDVINIQGKPSPNWLYWQEFKYLHQFNDFKIEKIDEIDSYLTVVGAKYGYLEYVKLCSSFNFFNTQKFGDVLSFHIETLPLYKNGEIEEFYGNDELGHPFDEEIPIGALEISDNPDWSTVENWVLFNSSSKSDLNENVTLEFFKEKYPNWKNEEFEHEIWFVWFYTLFTKEKFPFKLEDVTNDGNIRKLYFINRLSPDDNIKSDASSYDEKEYDINYNLLNLDPNYYEISRFKLEDMFCSRLEFSFKLAEKENSTKGFFDEDSEYSKADEAGKKKIYNDFIGFHRLRLTLTNPSSSKTISHDFGVVFEGTKEETKEETTKSYPNDVVFKLNSKVLNNKEIYEYDLNKNTFTYLSDAKKQYGKDATNLLPFSNKCFTKVSKLDTVIANYVFAINLILLGKEENSLNFSDCTFSCKLDSKYEIYFKKLNLSQTKDAFEIRFIFAQDFITDTYNKTKLNPEYIVAVTFPPINVKSKDGKTFNHDFYFGFSFKIADFNTLGKGKNVEDSAYTTSKDNSNSSSGGSSSGGSSSGGSSSGGSSSGGSSSGGSSSGGSSSDDSTSTNEKNALQKNVNSITLKISNNEFYTWYNEGAPSNENIMRKIAVNSSAGFNYNSNTGEFTTDEIIFYIDNNKDNSTSFWNCITGDVTQEISSNILLTAEEIFSTNDDLKYFENITSSIYGYNVTEKTIKIRIKFKLTKESISKIFKEAISDCKEKNIQINFETKDEFVGKFPLNSDFSIQIPFCFKESYLSKFGISDSNSSETEEQETTTEETKDALQKNVGSVKLTLGTGTGATNTGMSWKSNQSKCSTGYLNFSTTGTSFSKKSTSDDYCYKDLYFSFTNISEKFSVALKNRNLDILISETNENKFFGDNATCKFVSYDENKKQIAVKLGLKPLASTLQKAFNEEPKTSMVTNLKFTFKIKNSSLSTKNLFESGIYAFASEDDEFSIEIDIIFSSEDLEKLGYEAPETDTDTKTKTVGNNSIKNRIIISYDIAFSQDKKGKCNWKSVTGIGDVLPDKDDYKLNKIQTTDDGKHYIQFWLKDIQYKDCGEELIEPLKVTSGKNVYGEKISVKKTKQYLNSNKDYDLVYLKSILMKDSQQGKPYSFFFVEPGSETKKNYILNTSNNLSTKTPVEPAFDVEVETCGGEDCFLLKYNIDYIFKADYASTFRKYLKDNQGFGIFGFSGLISADLTNEKATNVTLCLGTPSTLEHDMSATHLYTTCAFTVELSSALTNLSNNTVEPATTVTKSDESYAVDTNANYSPNDFEYNPISFVEKIENIFNDFDYYHEYGGNYYSNGELGSSKEPTITEMKNNISYFITSLFDTNCYAEIPIFKVVVSNYFDPKKFDQVIDYFSKYTILRYDKSYVNNSINYNIYSVFWSQQTKDYNYLNLKDETMSILDFYNHGITILKHDENSREFIFGLKVKIKSNNEFTKLETYRKEYEKSKIDSKLKQDAITDLKNAIDASVKAQIEKYKSYLYQEKTFQPSQANNILNYGDIRFQIYGLKFYKFRNKLAIQNVIEKKSFDTMVFDSSIENSIFYYDKEKESFETYDYKFKNPGTLYLIPFGSLENLFAGMNFYYSNLLKNSSINPGTDNFKKLSFYLKFNSTYKNNGENTNFLDFYTSDFKNTNKINIEKENCCTTLENLTFDCKDEEKKKIIENYKELYGTYLQFFIPQNSNIFDFINYNTTSFLNLCNSSGKTYTDFTKFLPPYYQKDSTLIKKYEQNTLFDFFKKFLSGGNYIKTISSNGNQTFSLWNLNSGLKSTFFENCEGNYKTSFRVTDSTMSTQEVLRKKQVIAPTTPKYQNTYTGIFECLNVTTDEHGVVLANQLSLVLTGLVEKIKIANNTILKFDTDSTLEIENFFRVAGSFYRFKQPKDLSSKTNYITDFEGTEIKSDNTYFYDIDDSKSTIGQYAPLISQDEGNPSKNKSTEEYYSNPIVGREFELINGDGSATQEEEKKTKNLLALKNYIKKIEIKSSTGTGKSASDPILIYLSSGTNQRIKFSEKGEISIDNIEFTENKAVKNLGFDDWKQIKKLDEILCWCLSYGFKFDKNVSDEEKAEFINTFNSNKVNAHFQDYEAGLDFSYDMGTFLYFSNSTNQLSPMSFKYDTEYSETDKITKLQDIEFNSKLIPGNMVFRIGLCVPDLNTVINNSSYEKCNEQIFKLAIEKNKNSFWIENSDKLEEKENAAKNVNEDFYLWDYKKLPKSEKDYFLNKSNPVLKVMSNFLYFKIISKTYSDYKEEADEIFGNDKTEKKEFEKYCDSVGDIQKKCEKGNIDKDDLTKAIEEIEAKKTELEKDYLKQQTPISDDYQKKYDAWMAVLNEKENICNEKLTELETNVSVTGKKYNISDINTNIDINKVDYTLNDAINTVATSPRPSIPVSFLDDEEYKYNENNGILEIFPFIKNYSIDYYLLTFNSQTSSNCKDENIKNALAKKFQEYVNMENFNTNQYLEIAYYLYKNIPNYKNDKEIKNLHLKNFMFEDWTGSEILWEHNSKENPSVIYYRRVFSEDVLGYGRERLVDFVNKYEFYENMIKINKNKTWEEFGRIYTYYPESYGGKYKDLGISKNDPLENNNLIYRFFNNKNFVDEYKEQSYDPSTYKDLNSFVDENHKYAYLTFLTYFSIYDRLILGYSYVNNSTQTGDIDLIKTLGLGEWGAADENGICKPIKNNINVYAISLPYLYYDYIHDAIYVLNDYGVRKYLDVKDELEVDIIDVKPLSEESNAITSGKSTKKIREIKKAYKTFCTNHKDDNINTIMIVETNVNKIIEKQCKISNEIIHAFQQIWSHPNEIEDEKHDLKYFLNNLLKVLSPNVKNASVNSVKK